MFMFRRKGKKVICICMLLSFFSMSVVANIVPNKIDHQLKSMNKKTIIVDDKGNGDYTTIQAALDACHNGDTIEVYSGHYPEYINRSDRSDLRIIGYNTVYKKGTYEHPPIIDGRQITTVVTFVNCQLIMDGFIIMNSSRSGNYVGIYLKDCISCTIRNNTIYDNEYGIVLDSCNDGNCIISYNIINNTIMSGIYFSSTSLCTIQYNHIRNSGYNAITLVNSRNNNIFSNNLSFNTKDGIKILSDPLNIQIGYNKILSNNIVGNGEECEQLFSFLNQWMGNWWGQRMSSKIIFIHQDPDYVNFPPIMDFHPAPIPIEIP